MSIAKRLKNGAEAYRFDNLSQNDFIHDIGISRNLFFELKFNPSFEKIMRPLTKRNIIKSLAKLGF